MSRVLASRGNTIVTGTASTQDLRVIDGDRRYECSRVVAVFAHIGSRHVCGTLACCVSIIVATDAVSDDADVIEACWNPARCGVAVVALIVGRNMIQCFAGRLDAIVAADTTTG